MTSGFFDKWELIYEYTPNYESNETVWMVKEIDDYINGSMDGDGIEERIAKVEAIGDYYDIIEYEAYLECKLYIDAYETKQRDNSNCEFGSKPAEKEFE